MHGSRDSRIVKFLVALALALALPAGARAAEIPVTITADVVAAGGGCSLREAVTAANTDSAPASGCTAGSGPDTILLGAGTYVLSGAAGEDTNMSGDLDIKADTIIDGAGDGNTIIDADHIDRVFDINNSGNQIDVTFQQLAIKNGNATGATDGGAIRMTDADGTISIRELTISDSRAGRHGGAVSFTGAQAVVMGQIGEIVDSEFRGNSSVGAGGAVYHTSDGFFGSVLLVARSTLSGNSAGTTGGAVHAASNAQMQIVNSTLSGNSALQGGGAFAFSGTSTTPKLDLRFSTIADNTTPLGSGAGAIQADSNSDIVDLRGSIIAGNLANGAAVNCARVTPATPPFVATSKV